MRIKDILKGYFDEPDEGADDDQIKHIFVKVPESLLQSDCLALESYWKPSSYKDYMMRIDPEDPNIPQQRHVHIARKKHTSSKSKQVSWNADGSRHDRGSFDEKSVTNTVRDIARKALKLDATITLESFSADDHPCVFEESVVSIVDESALVKVSIV
ncbi:DUF6367 family protein [Methylotuvimicrobium buryatense]|uniref:DUF6367 family protein n=1 Tax=Methylotuvimicrobium TaxID=2822410 RepID=UPI00036D8442|nr:DUF6367 family protein [Methylotuvimicrobium buryatense]